jgi:cytochrome c-type biogenesis protein CcmF
MIPELGQFALSIAFVLAIVLATVPLVASFTGSARGMALARPAAAGQFAFLLLAFGVLTYAFMVHDFSVVYVATNSNLLLPWYYRFSAVWGGHEGSLLLWVLILATWTVAVAALSRNLPEVFIARVLAVMGWIAVGFLAFTIFTSNPFERHLPALPDGRDLNPLLQDIGLIMHPPMLYMGYVGFAVAFAFAVAALLDKKVDERWVRYSRPWTLVAWAFLTLGIALGSWWAYYELGWGGWWFWDPVENASFMPWLVGTALIHSQAVTEKRGSFRAWTLLLAISAFSLSLLGTFLVRSGVLTSVHAFATDPTRGTFILIFLGIIAGGALLLYALRAPMLESRPEQPFAPVSRESLLLVNNLMMVSACGMVLLGTLYPLLADAMGWGKVSVGPPYFGFLFMLLMIPVVVFIVFGPFARWQREQLATLVLPARVWLVFALLVTAAVWLLFQGVAAKTLFGVLGGAWVMAGTVAYTWRQLRDPARRAALNGGRLGMLVAHFGLGVFVAGVLVHESTVLERDVRMAPGDTTELRGYSVTFKELQHYEGPNFVADKGIFEIRDGDRVVMELRPQKRAYASGGSVMTEAAIDAGFFRDVYISLGEPIGDQGAWAVRLYHKPLVRWIWLGALLMMFGGFIAAADRRYRVRAASPAAPAGNAAAPPPAAAPAAG